MKSNSSVATLMVSGLLALTTPVFVNSHKADAQEYKFATSAYIGRQRGKR